MFQTPPGTSCPKAFFPLSGVLCRFSEENKVIIMFQESSLNVRLQTKAGVTDAKWSGHKDSWWIVPTIHLFGRLPLIFLFIADRSIEQVPNGSLLLNYLAVYSPIFKCYIANMSSLDSVCCCEISQQDVSELYKWTKQGRTS